MESSEGAGDDMATAATLFPAGSDPKDPNLVKVVTGDTASSVNQGGASSASGISEDGKQLRAADAEARRVLVDLAAEKLGVAAEQLSVDGGVVHSNTEMAKSVTYAELVGGRYFNVTLAWNGKIGNPLYAPGKARPKDPKDYKIVGQLIKRQDIAPKVFAQQDFCTDINGSENFAFAVHFQNALLVPLTEIDILAVVAQI